MNIILNIHCIHVYVVHSKLLHVYKQCLIEIHISLVLLSNFREIETNVCTQY